MKRDLYADVTARILHELEAGAVPWVKPWSSTPGLNVPQNAATKRPYSGINVILLWLAADRGWPTPWFVTYKQATELGGHVRKGEHGTKVYFYKQLEVKDRSVAGASREPTANSEEATKFIPLLREYTVFNIAQCDDLPARIIDRAAPKPRHNDERDATIDEFLAATGAQIREGAGEAYYAPGADFISMPAFRAFKSAHLFYGVAFHELAHWTGHKSRLDRFLKLRDGRADLAAEELVAELTSAFLCAEFSIDGHMRHAAYIESWIKHLKDDPRAFLKAAAKAQKAADYLRGLALAEPVAEAA